MDAPNLKNQGEPVASPNATQTSQLEVPIINSTSMQARRNRNIIFAVSAVVVFLLVLTTTLLILNSVRSSSSTDSNTSDLDVEQDEDIVVEDEEENENEEVDDVEEDEDITAETPALTQECKDELKGIKFGMPAGWTCTTSSANFGASSFMLTANSNDANQTQFVLSNLGRGPYCYTVPMGDTNSEPDCTLSEFYKNPNMTITYFNASQGGELFGGVNLKNYESEWISITGNSIGKGKTISESDKNLFIAMLETIHTYVPTTAEINDSGMLLKAFNDKFKVEATSTGGADFYKFPEDFNEYTFSIAIGGKNLKLTTPGDFTSMYNELISFMKTQGFNHFDKYTPEFSDSRSNYDGYFQSDKFKVILNLTVINDSEVAVWILIN